MTRQIKQHVKNELERNPITFIINLAQLLILLGGLVTIGYKVGAFTSQVEFMKNNVSEVGKRLDDFLTVYADDKYKNNQNQEIIKNAISAHTGKPIP